MRLRAAAKRALRRAGWDLNRHPAPWDAAHRRSVLLAHLGVDLVIDVGANSGQYAGELRAYGYRGEVLSLEPTEGAFAQLAANASRDPHWTAIRTAAGARSGTETINVTRNSVSSSILPVLDRHIAAAPESAVAFTEEVCVERLDSLALSRASEAGAPFLKVDAQGYEREVLDGAAALLPLLAGLELELSLVPLYGEQDLWQTQVEYLEGRGFGLAGVAGGFWDRETGEMLQADALFVAGSAAT
jgi:FkbM family methyltransferase